MAESKRPLLTRSEVVFVILVAGATTPLLVLAPKPSGWLLVLDVLLSALLGLLIALVVASVVRFFERGPKGR